jgi:hypothetical protein
MSKQNKVEKLSGKTQVAPSDQTHNNDHAAKNPNDYPFRFLSGNNTLYHIVSEIAFNLDSDLITEITKHSAPKLTKKRGKIEEWLDSHACRAVDLVVSQRAKFFPANKHSCAYDEVIDEWYYISFQEGTPFKRCICGDVTRYFHQVRHCFGKTLYIGSCCIEVFLGSRIHSVGKSIENLMENVFEPLGLSLIEHAYRLNFINDDENKMLRNEVKMADVEGYGINFLNLDYITQVTTIKARIGLMMMNGIALDKFTQNLVTLYHEMITVAWGETDVINEREMDFIKAGYWVSLNEKKKYAKTILDISEKRYRNAKLSGQQQLVWDRYIKDEGNVIEKYSEDPEFITLKENFISFKVGEIETVITKLKQQVKTIHVPVVTHETYLAAVEEELHLLAENLACSRAARDLDFFYGDKHVKETKQKEPKKDEKTKAIEKKALTAQHELNNETKSNIVQTKLTFEKKKPTKKGYIVVRGCEPLIDISESMQMDTNTKDTPKPNAAEENPKTEETPFNFINPSITSLFKRHKINNDPSTDELDNTMDVDSDSILKDSMDGNIDEPDQELEPPKAHKKQKKREFIPDEEIDFDLTKDTKKQDVIVVANSASEKTKIKLVPVDDEDDDSIFLAAMEQLENNNM